MGSADCRAMAVQADRILATGELEGLKERYPQSEVISFGDATVMPGFNDAHLHLCPTAEMLLTVDVSSKEVSSIVDIKNRIRKQTETQRPGTWIKGSRYDDGKLKERRPLTRWDLDEAAPNNPVIVLHVAGHGAVVNSAALSIAGLDDHSLPPAGGQLGRDANGHLNGALLEQAFFDFARPRSSRTGRVVVPSAPMEEKLSGLRRAARMFNAAGITSVTDAHVGPEDWQLLRAASTADLTLRVNTLVAVEHYEQLLRLKAGDAGSTETDVRIAGIKTFVDGAVAGRTCLLEEPFEGTSDDYGLQIRSTPELRDTVSLAHRDRLPACLHANGDRAISLALDLFEQAQANDPAPNLNHRVEHCTLVTEEMLLRMKRVHALATPFGSYVHYHGGNLIKWFGEQRIQRMFAHRWFIDSGVAVAGSSDFPAGPYPPLLAIQSCVTRRGWDGTVLGEGQRIKPLEAMSLYTTRAAASTQEQTKKGILAPGMVADFVVLGADPREVTPDSIASIPVQATYLAGRCVWSALQ
jgi:predicted amidohydrolase YtcJ